MQCVKVRTTWGGSARGRQRGLGALWGFFSEQDGVGGGLQDSSKFLEAVRAAVLLSIAFCIVLRFLADNGGEDQLAAWLAAWGLPSLEGAYYPLE